VLAPPSILLALPGAEVIEGLATDPTPPGSEAAATAAS
jgi:hypothetical protein